MRVSLLILAFATIALAPAHAADAPERYSSPDRYLVYEDDVYVATRERGNYVVEEEPYEERIVVRRRVVEEVAPYDEPRLYVRSPRYHHRIDRGPRWRHDRPYRRERWVGRPRW
jgi:hypothetical protein